MKKQFTIKELAKVVNVSEGTIRSWIMKPIDGQPYSSENVNYENLVSKLNKYFPEFEGTFGFNAGDIEIVKAQRTTKVWLSIEDLKELEVNTIVTMHNYSLKTELRFIRYIEDLDLFIFGSNDENSNYKAYASYKLEMENIKIEKVEA